jgi:hypothetical protein
MNSNSRLGFSKRLCSLNALLAVKISERMNMDAERRATVARIRPDGLPFLMSDRNYEAE